MTREQFIQQVKIHEKPFRKFLMALCCGDPMLADDIAQESYMKAYLSVEKLESPEKFRYWLFRIAHNTFISHKRAQKQTFDIDDAYGVRSERESDESFKFESLHLALQQLSPKVRTSVLLYYMEGYCVREVAEIIDAGEDAVRQHLARGRKQIKEFMEKK